MINYSVNDSKIVLGNSRLRGGSMHSNFGHLNMSKIPCVTIGIAYTLIFWRYCYHKEVLKNDNKPSLMIIAFRVDS